MLPIETQVLGRGLDWASPVRYLRGVGPEKQKLLARLGLDRVGDLFYFFPRRYEKRFPVKKVSELTYTGKECVGGTVTSRSLLRLKGGRSVFRAIVSDGQRSLQVLYYHQPYLAEVFEPGSRVLFFGKTEKRGRRALMVHPEYEFCESASADGAVHTGRWTPVYPLTEDLPQKVEFNRSWVWGWIRKSRRVTLPGMTLVTIPGLIRRRSGKGREQYT